MPPDLVQVARSCAQVLQTIDAASTAGPVGPRAGGAPMPMRLQPFSASATGVDCVGGS